MVRAAAAGGVTAGLGGAVRLSAPSRLRRPRRGRRPRRCSPKPGRQSSQRSRPPERPGCSQRLRADMRLATAANEAYTASLAVSELLGCKQCGGGRGQDEVPGRGAWRAGARGRERAGTLPSCLGCRMVVSPPRRFPLTASETAFLGGRPWPAPCAAGASRRGRRPPGEGATCDWRGRGETFPIVVPGRKLPGWKRQLSRSFKWKPPKRK